MGRNYQSLSKAHWERLRGKDLRKSPPEKTVIFFLWNKELHSTIS